MYIYIYISTPAHKVCLYDELLIHEVFRGDLNKGLGELFISLQM